MARVIIWNKRAQEKFDKVVIYFENEWSKNIAENFVKITYRNLVLLSKFPFIGKKSDKKPSVRLLNITRHNQLFYRVEKEELLFSLFLTCDKIHERNHIDE